VTVTQSEKGAAFRALHEGEPFVIPNPRDAGSARATNHIRDEGDLSGMASAGRIREWLASTQARQREAV
jgi:2-methylisocitrate lyase-like PEP mutase family enzyme